MTPGGRGIDRSWWVKFGLLTVGTLAVIGTLMEEDDPPATADVVASTETADALAELAATVTVTSALASPSPEFATTAAPSTDATTTTTTTTTTPTTTVPNSTTPPTTVAVLPQPIAAPSCDPSYPEVCIPPFPPDLDCGEISYRRFKVIGPDLHGFDRDGDGIGCERN